MAGAMSRRLRRCGTATAGGGGGEGTTLFESNYTNGTGRGQTAITDGGLWPWPMVGYDASDGSEIVSAASVSFPAAGGVLRSVSNTPEGGFLLPFIGGWAEPGPGDTHNVRFSFRFDQVYEGDAHQHPIQDVPDALNAAVGDSTLPWYTTYFSSTTWKPSWRPQTAAGENPSHRGLFAPTSLLDTGTVYQFEHQVVVLTESTFRFHARILSAAGAELFTDATIDNDDVNGGNPLVALSSNPEFNVNAEHGLSTFCGSTWGCNGMSGNPTNEPYAHMSNFKVVRGLAEGSWIGAAA